MCCITYCQIWFCHVAPWSNDDTGWQSQNSVSLYDFMFKALDFFCKNLVWTLCTWSTSNEPNYRCENILNLCHCSHTAILPPSQHGRFLFTKIPPQHIFQHMCSFYVSTKVRLSMLTHYHKAEGIQIIGPLKPSNVNWAKLQLARVAVAVADAYIITVCCLPWQEKKALMNLPWLLVFSTIVLIAHIQHMWQVAVNPFSSISYSTLFYMSLSLSSNFMFISLSSEVTVCLWLWVYLSMCRLFKVCRPPAVQCEAVSFRVAKGKSQSIAFPSIHVQLVWLSGDLIVATIGLSVKVREMIEPFKKQTMQAGKTIRCNPNLQDKHTHPSSTHHPHKANYWHPIWDFFLSLAVNTAHSLQGDK